MKMSDYILEQDISSASVMDIELAQSYAEMSVATALMECYLKQEAIIEYASCDASEFGVFMEAGDGKSTDKAKFTDVIKNTWHKVINWITSVAKSLYYAIAKKSPKKSLFYLDKCPDDTKFELSYTTLRNMEHFDALVDAMDTLADALEVSAQGVAANSATGIAKYNKIIQTVEDINGSDKLQDMDATNRYVDANELRKTLKKMADGDLEKRVQSFYKKFEKIAVVKKAEFKVDDTTSTKGKKFDSDGYNAAVKVNKEYVDVVTKAVKVTGQAVQELSKGLNTIFDDVIKKAYKESKKKD